MRILPASPTTLGERAVFVALALSVALCLFTYGYLDFRQNDHASLYYLVLFHVLVLPLLIWYWRLHRENNPVELRIPRMHFPVAIVFALLAITVGKTTEHGRMISDESAYMFQGRILAAGKLKAEPMASGSSNYRAREIYFEHTIQTPTGWFSKYPLGWPVLLAVGYLLKCPWLVNPFLGLLQLILVWRLARPWGSTTQILAILFAGTSGYMLVSSVGFMPHAADAVVCLLALSCLLKGLHEKRMGWIVLCFSLVVASTMIRPYSGAVLGIVCTAVVLYRLKPEPRRLLQALLVAGAAAIFAAGGFFLVNWLLTGDAFLSPYALSRGQQHIRELTFNPVEIAKNIASVWRWAITDTVRVTFPFMFLFAIYACWKERTHRPDLICLSLLFPALVGAYFLQFEGSGSFDGERYYFEGFCAIALVAARGFEILVSSWKVSRANVLDALMLLVVTQVAFLFFTIKDIQTTLRPYREAYKLAVAPPLVPLEFLSGTVPGFFISKHINWNDANWRQARTVYLIDPGPDWREAVACRFGRPSYRVVRYDAQTKRLSRMDVTARCAGQQ